MISRPEYTTNSKELDNLGSQYAKHMEEQLAELKTVQATLKKARQIQQNYHNAMTQHVLSSLKEVGRNASQHYARITGLPETTIDLDTILGEMLVERYYGASLYDRFEISRRRGLYNLTRAAHVGKNLETRKRNLVRFFLEVYPFGAQVHYDRRIMLSESVRLEHIIGLRYAAKAGIDLIKWTLSHRHSVKDICDKIAERQSDDIKAYIDDHNIKVDPAGVYFIDEVPDPPHPNCQCILVFIKREPIMQKVTRPVSTIRRLIRRLLRR